MIPYPILELSMEQEFKLQHLKQVLEKADKAQAQDACLSLQRQVYVLTNTLQNLVSKWRDAPDETGADFD